MRPWRTLTMTESRTILTELITSGQDSPLRNGSYFVVACRLIAYGGFTSDEITTRVIDNHFLIVNRPVWNNRPVEEILRIVNIDKITEAEDLLYLEAKKIAERRAKKDGNRVIDITSKNKIIPEEAQYYVESNWSRLPPSYWTRKK